MNALILHVPKGFWLDDQRHSFINVLPMGVFAIANHCNERGHGVWVTNAAAFADRDQALQTVVRRVRNTNAQVVGLSLHWHLSGYDVLTTAHFLKKLMPDLKIVLGGLTASIYAVELMDSCPAIDGIIIGDGEVPFCKYLDAHASSWNDPDLAAVPNLVWRTDGLVHQNPVTYVANSEQLSELDFSPHERVFSVPEYTSRMRIEDAVRGRISRAPDRATRETLFFMNTGRGCNFNCIYCAGSAVAQKKYCHRSCVTMRSLSSVLADFQRCYAAGFRRFHLGLDPAFIGKEDYYEQLFGVLGKSIGPDLQLVFEAYGLPSRSFLSAACSAFSWVGIIISPCFFGADVRKVYKGYFFSDHDLMEKLQELRAYTNSKGFVYYAITCLEDWSEESIDQRVSHMQAIQDRYACEISALPIYAEPGSPWVSFPELYGKRFFNLSFEDFLAEWRKPFIGWNDRLTGISGTERVMGRIQTVGRMEVLQS